MDSVEEAAAAVEASPTATTTAEATPETPVTPGDGGVTAGVEVVSTEDAADAVAEAAAKAIGASI